MLNGENGAITTAIEAKFFNEMHSLDEQKEISKFMSFMTEGEEDDHVTSEFLERYLTAEEIGDLSNTLKAEIIFVRNSFGDGSALTTKQIWKKNLFQCQDIYSNEDYVDGLTKDLAYISVAVAGVEHGYIYDTVTDTCYKIKKTTINGKVVHSLIYEAFIVHGQGSTGRQIIDTDVAIIAATDGTKSYEPDLTNFTNKTEVIYYSPDFSDQRTMGVKEFIDKGKPANQDVDGTTYTFANYVSTDSGDTKVWANIKTTANGLEAYWTWIPRYAYKLDSEHQTSDIIFVDVDDNPCDGSELPDGYVVHEAFKQKEGLKGIWFSKYQPSPLETTAVDSTEPETPDLSNFSSSDTKLIYYTLDGKNTIEVDYTASPEQKITQGGKDYYFYKYKNKIWANVKTTANGLDAWWVWIPRYAYKLEKGQCSVILVDLNDKPIDTQKYGNTLPQGYTVHEAFSQSDGLGGIWFSKYQPTKVTQ